LTRNPTTTKCMNLKTKWGSALELWKCDMTQADEVIRAFEGCYGAFCVTDFWSNPEMMVKEEFNIGRILIDSAVKARVKQCVFSSLPNATVISEGILTVPHLTNKARVEEYAMTEFKGRNIGTEFSFVWAGCYLQNFSFFPAMSLFINKEGVLENQPLNLAPNTKIPWINMEEFGGFVLAQFDNWDEFKGKRMYAFNGFATVPEILNWAGSTLGTTSKYTRISHDELYQMTQSLELVHMFRLFEEFDAFPTTSNPREYFPNLKTLKEATTGMDWKSYVKTDLATQITTKIGEVTGYVGEKLGTVKEAIVDTAHKLRENLSSKQAE